MPWYGFARVSDLFLDQAFCRALKRSGCVMLKLGIESGDQGVLDALGKGVRVEVASAALTNLKNAGIATYVYLLFGTPPETIESARRTLDFTVSHAPSIDFLNLALFNLPTFGPDAERFQTNAFYEGDLSLYCDFKHPEGWDRPLVRHFLDRVFKKHPDVSAILKRVPPIFTSNHAPFFLPADRLPPSTALESMAFVDYDAPQAIRMLTREDETEMRCWPVRGSARVEVSASGTPGHFWEDRGDRRHCGMDIHAPAGSDVVAVEAGEVVTVAPFTSPQAIPYWNETFYVLIRHESGHFCKYAELGTTAVLPGEPVEAGQVIGQVGMVLERPGHQGRCPSLHSEAQRGGSRKHAAPGGLPRHAQTPPQLPGRQSPRCPKAR